MDPNPPDRCLYKKGHQDMQRNSSDVHTQREGHMHAKQGDGHLQTRRQAPGDPDLLTAGLDSQFPEL